MIDFRGGSTMRLLDLKDLTAEHFKTFGEQRELTAAQKAEVIRLYMAEFKVEDLQEYANWRDATSVDGYRMSLQGRPVPIWTRHNL